MRNKYLVFIGSFLLLSGLACFANASIITNYDRATFQIAVNGGTVTEQNFDSLLASSILNVDAAGVTYTASLGSSIVTDNWGTTTSPNGLGSTGNGLEYFQGAETASFYFTVPITAFAIDVNTFDHLEGAYVASLDIGDTISSVFDPFFTGGGMQGQFFGFISDTPFSAITIGANNGMSYTLDTLVYGDAQGIIKPVPEPATMLLFCLGLLGLAGVIRKKE